MLNKIIKTIYGDYRVINSNQNELNYSLFRSVLLILVSSISWCIGLYIKDVSQFDIFYMIISLSILGWGFWAVTIWYIANRILNINLNYRLVLRNLAFSYWPGILMLLIGFNIINDNFIWIISRTWTLIISVFVFKNFSEISLKKSFGLVVFGWISTQIIFGKFY